MKNQKSRELRPYISTTELLDMTGITRKTLRVYEDKGIVKPAHVENGYFKYWTLEQANDLERIALLAQGKRSLSEVAGLFSQGEQAVAQEAYAQAVTNDRAARRMLKSSTHYRRRVRDFSAIGTSNELYLRSIPQRWLALIPLDPGFAGAPSDAEFIDKYWKLRSIIEVVGWAGTNSYGCLFDIDAEGNARDAFLYIELSSAPAPAPSDKHDLDCGCYLEFLGDRHEHCDGTHCFECALFGRKPTAEERKAWQKEEATRTPAPLLINDMEAPYICGPWSVYSKRRLGVSDEGTQMGVGGPLLRPQFMPQEVRLPYGASACALPNGRYLCLQTGQKDRARKVLTFSKLLSKLETEPLTRAIEEQAFKRDLHRVRESQKQRAQLSAEPVSGFHLEPSAQLYFERDDIEQGWSRTVSREQLGQIILPDCAALTPDAARTVVVEHTPLGKQEGKLLHEVQALVSKG